MTAEQRAELGPFAVDLARRYHEDSRASAELDPVFRKLWEDGAKDELPRAEAYVRQVAAAITARLTELRQAGPCASRDPAEQLRMVRRGNTPDREDARRR